jgi:putative flippase GtrA
LRIIKKLERLASLYSLAGIAYFGVSVVSALVEWGTFYISFRAVGPYGAAIIAFFMATHANYILSREIFNPVREPVFEVIFFYVGSAAAFMSNLAALYIFLEWVGVNPMASKVLGTCAGFGFNFVVRQFFVFDWRPKFTLSDLRR